MPLSASNADPGERASTVRQSRVEHAAKSADLTMTSWTWCCLSTIFLLSPPHMSFLTCKETFFNFSKQCFFFFWGFLTKLHHLRLARELHLCVSLQLISKKTKGKQMQETCLVKCQRLEDWSLRHLEIQGQVAVNARENWEPECHRTVSAICNT